MVIFCLFQIYQNQYYNDYVSVIFQNEKKDNPICRLVRIFDKPQHFDSECGHRKILFNE